MNRVSPHKQDHFSELGYPYFDPIDEYLNLWDCWDHSDLPMLTCIDDHSGTTCSGTTAADQGGRNGRWRSIPLELEEIEKHFELPIAVAAEKLGVGLTLLKKRCREFNIKRWPHRKLKRIKSFIQNVQVYISLYHSSSSCMQLVHKCVYGLKGKIAILRLLLFSHPKSYFRISFHFISLSLYLCMYRER
ncbi:putative transcription factor Nin-like family [Helianthus annuus]|nr:putative transcription factor Nin-like family [Helianthus annuus]